MPTIPRSVISSYSDGIEEIIKQHQEGLLKALGNVNWSASVSSVREELIEVMEVWCAGSTDSAAMLAAVFYDGIREQSVGAPIGAAAQSMREPERTSGAVRAFVHDLTNGRGTQSVVRKCLERLDYETKKSAAECIDYNARRDPNKPRYARVPSGFETCDFCIMLASRGPVYHTERSAGAFDHWHANCRCRVVPMWDSVEVLTGNGGIVRRGGTKVQGYDPDALYDHYIDSVTDPKFRAAIARTGGGSGRETSHPMRWAEAKSEGLVTLGSVGEVTDYIREAKDYEDLFKRIELVSKEWEHYALSEKFRKQIEDVMRRTRSRIINGESK